MTVQSQVSGQTRVSVFMPRDYDVFAGLDVDHHSIATTFTDHRRLLRSLRLPYSAAQLLNYVRKHFPGQRLAFVYEAAQDVPKVFSLLAEKKIDAMVTNAFPLLEAAKALESLAP